MNPAETMPKARDTSILVGASWEGLGQVTMGGRQWTLQLASLSRSPARACASCQDRDRLEPGCFLSGQGSTNRMGEGKPRFPGRKGGLQKVSCPQTFTPRAHQKKCWPPGLQL